jgi:glucosamine--fructose-6-phosphate aminotransferase (isomerizing)
VPENFFLREISEQPQVLARLLEEGAPFVESAARAIRAAQPAWALIAARGSSDNAARYGQYLLGARNGLGVGLAVPSLFTLYQSPPRLERALVIGISQSGQSPDIVSVLEEGARQGAVTLAVTNDTASPLARAAAHVLPLLAGEERAVAATKTYSAELFVLALLSAELTGGASERAELRALVGQVDAALSLNGDLEVAARHFAESDKFVVLGRGYNYATAFELALKIKETSYLIAEPYSIADFLHGPVAMIDRGFPVVLTAPSGKGTSDVPELLTLLEQRLVTISDDPAILSRAHAPLRLPPGVPEWLSPLVSIAPGQLFASALAQARGRDPDHPRGLSKVTLTR